MNTQPIGMFDSGIGGTSIWSEIVRLLPNEHTIYLADSKYAPYGERSSDDIVSLSIKNTEKLIQMGCKMIVVACNTATTNAIRILREQYAIPFVGIEPAIKTAALATKTKKVGVLATKGTLSSKLFSDTSGRYANDVELIEVIGKGLVPLIEQDKIDDAAMRTLLQTYLTPMLEQDIDYLVLGCSHYPYLIPLLRSLIPAHIKIVDSGEAVAKQTEKLLRLHGINGNVDAPNYQFFTNSNTETLCKILDRHQYPYNAQYMSF